MIWKASYDDDDDEDYIILLLPNESILLNNRVAVIFVIKPCCHLCQTDPLCPKIDHRS